jgi:type I restriction enzyme R subunit
VSADNRNPEQRARVNIDAALEAAGWAIQDRKSIDLRAGRGIAVREFQTPTGPVDYLLYVDRKAAGTLEAKKEGVTLGSVEPQTKRYSDGLAAVADKDGLPNWQLPLPFHYISTGVETVFVDLRDPDPRPREVFSFHRPETLAEWLEQGTSLRTRLQTLPPLDGTGLRPVQVEAITGLELSCRDNKPKALVKMSGGAGKTYVGVATSYRLLRHAGAKRILFMVDRINLGRQAYDEFANYLTPDDGRKFGDIYNIQLLRSNRIDPAASVVITTVQRLYSILRGEAELAEDLEETSLFELESGADQKPIELSYRPEVPVELFDVIWVDECHRSIYGKYGEVLDYFDAFTFGLSATPTGLTYGYFNGNVVTDYSYEQSVVDGINVDFQVYRIKTRISEEGATIGEGETVRVRDRASREVSYREMDDELTYDKKKLDRAVVVPDQIRTVIRTFKEKLPTEIFPGRTEVPKTVIFCKDDSHAEDVLKIVREEFNAGWEFARKITYKSEEATDDLIRDLRNDPRFRIAITVDQIATGTDIKPLECLLFLRFIQSRTHFEQMKYRGVRTINDDDLRAVTGSATSKEHFVLVDAIGVTDEKRAWVDAKPVDREPSAPLERLLQRVSMGHTDADLLSTVGGRVAKLAKRLKDDEIAAIETEAGTTLHDLAEALVIAADPEKHEEAARREANGADPTPEQVEAAKLALVESAVDPLHSAALRKLLVEAQRMLEQVIDFGRQDELLSAGPADQGAAAAVVQSFKEFIEANHDEYVALKAFYGQPRSRRVSLADLKQLAEAIKAPPYLLTPEKIWQAYEKLEADRVRGRGGKIPADLVSLLRFTLHTDETDELIPHRDVVRLRFDLWLSEQGGNGKFTPEQMRWLEMVRDHMEESLTIEPEDFDLDPFDRHGGLVGAYQTFGDDLTPLLEELNRVVSGA